MDYKQIVRLERRPGHHVFGFYTGHHGRVYEWVHAKKTRRRGWEITMASTSKITPEEAVGLAEALAAAAVFCTKNDSSR